MRSHADIIRDAGGAHAVAARLHPRIKGELTTLQSRIRGWVLQSSIPGDYWRLIADLRISTLEELARAAEERRRAKTDQPPHENGAHA